MGWILTTSVAGFRLGGFCKLSFPQHIPVVAQSKGHICRAVCLRRVFLKIGQRRAKDLLSSRSCVSCQSFQIRKQIRRGSLILLLSKQLRAWSCEDSKAKAVSKGLLVALVMGVDGKLLLTRAFPESLQAKS